MMGFGLATTERIVYDHQLGLPANVQFDQAKPQDLSRHAEEVHWSAVDRPDRDNPVGVKGIGEPIMGAAASASDQRHLRTLSAEPTSTAPRWSAT